MHIRAKNIAVFIKNSYKWMTLSKIKILFGSIYYFVRLSVCLHPHSRT